MKCQFLLFSFCLNFICYIFSYFDTAKIRIYFYCAIKYITFLLFYVVKFFLV
nr:MAG TPA: hypothetical protein [Caudoviricetes sp.]